MFVNSFRFFLLIEGGHYPPLGSVNKEIDWREYPFHLLDFKSTSIRPGTQRDFGVLDDNRLVHTQLVTSKNKKSLRF